MEAINRRGQESLASPSDKVGSPTIVVDRSANPPARFWSLTGADRSLKALWSREQPAPRQRDTTPSGWCLQLRNSLARAGYDAQEIADTLVAYRRMHRDRSKPDDWYVAEATGRKSTGNGTSAAAVPVGLLEVSNRELTSLRATDAAIRHCRLQ